MYYKMINKQGGRDAKLLNMIEGKLNPSFEAKDKTLNNTSQLFE